MGMNNSTGTPDIIPEGTRAFVADANLKEIQTLMRLISQRAPDPQTRATLAQDLLCGPTGEGSRRSFADGVVSASDIPPGAPPLAQPQAISAPPTTVQERRLKTRPEGKMYLVSCR